tara:strand:- start:5999 stop:7237 length:1239 start_codon:yes stop_codon:yes gene_type:complete
MQATTSGATHKVDIYYDDVVKGFLKKQSEIFLNFKNKNALYTNKTLITTPGLNYINVLPENKVELSIKNLILKEYNNSESLYPYLGDLFLEIFFSQKILKNSSIFRFNKSNEKKFLESIADEKVRNIISWIFNNSSLERTINIDTHNGRGIIFENDDNFSFRFSYDYDFFKNASNLTFRNYKFIIIDGFIESVGEVHHLFEKANKNKLPYVIFCYGMSEEVKHNIMINNKKGRFTVLPVSLDVNDENTLNILNDIAVIHNGEVISSNMGQTISQEVRKDLRSGFKITFYKEKIQIDPVIDYNQIQRHKLFLHGRLDDAIEKVDVNTKPIRNRIKNFSLKSLNIYIPHHLKSDNTFQRDLAYSLNFLKNINRHYKVLTCDKRVYYIPDTLTKVVEEKVKSLKRTIEDISVIIS